MFLTNLLRAGAAILALSAASFQAHAAPTPERDAKAGSTARLTAVMDRTLPGLLVQYHVPGAAVAIVEDGKIVAVRTYGFADQEARRAVTPETLFNIGSVSKTVAIWGMMRLVADKKVDLDAPVETYVTRWHLPNSDYDRTKVNLRRLVSHTAGLNVSGYPGWTALDQRKTIEQSLSGDNAGAGALALVSEPGSKWSYSGGGYTLAQLMVEERTGQDFGTYYDRRIFPAMGLADTHFTVTPALLERAARGYDGQGKRIPTRVFTEMAAAGLFTNIKDFGRIVALTVNGGRTETGKAFLPPDLAAAMLAPQLDHMPPDRFPDIARILGVADAISGRNESFGLGYHLYTLPDGRKVVGHTGANYGWRAGILAIPGTRQGIAVLTNADGGVDVREAAFCYWRRHLDAPVDAADCPPPPVTALRLAYQKGGVDAVAGRLQDLKREPAGKALSDGTYVELAYTILSLTQERTGRNPVADALRLLDQNLEAYPDSAATLVGLARLHGYAGDKAKARSFAERALKASGLLDDERQELQAMVVGP